MARQQDRSSQTRAALLKAFRTAFLRQGYEATTTQKILDATGLSKGALYHHFASKTEVLEAVYEAESRRAIERALNSAPDNAPPLERLKAALLAWIEIVRAPSTARILFEIGPSALGVQRAREIEAAHSLGQIEALLNEAHVRGDTVDTDRELLAASLNALVAEALLHTRRTGRPAQTSLHAMIEALLSSIRK